MPRMMLIRNSLLALLIVLTFAVSAHADTFSFIYYPRNSEWLDQYSQIATAIRNLIAQLDTFAETTLPGLYVPYTGATSNVNLGSRTITSTAYTGFVGTASVALEASHAIDADTCDTAEDSLRLGYQLPAYFLARANHTGTQAPATISPQGTGSTLDADLLDGKHETEFAELDETNVFTANDQEIEVNGNFGTTMRLDNSNTSGTSCYRAYQWYEGANLTGYMSQIGAGSVTQPNAWMIWNARAAELKFGTSNLARVFIGANGALGVGTDTTPDYDLDVQSTAPGGGDIHADDDITADGYILANGGIFSRTLGTYYGITDGATYLIADTNVYIDMDDDNDGTAKAIFRNGANTEVAEVDESGNVQCDGDMTVSGGNLTTGSGDPLYLGNTDRANTMYVDGGYLRVSTDFAGNAFGVINDGDAATRLGMYIQSGQDVWNVQNDLIQFYDGNGDLQGWISGNGTTVSLTGFCGAHEVETKDSFEIGEIVSMTGINSKGRAIVKRTIKAKDKATYGGIYSAERRISVAAVGEWKILVCSDGGDIEIGDYLTSSNRAGLAMKQDDDLLHNYTVAKANEDVDWSKEPATKKLIHCTYHCQ